jgi:tetratricopeptide (TPR) repeat protein
LVAALLAATGAAAAPRPPRDPDPVEARLRYRACAAAHREEGVELCRAALAGGLSTGRAALAQLLLARDLGALERWEEALAAHREALRLRPDDPDAARRVGTTLLHALGRAADAEPYLRQALAGRSDDAATHVDLGLALNALARHEEALGEFRAALALDPLALDERPAAAAVYEASQRERAWP